jgi:uncharacterized protein (TIGR00369 family)
MNLPDPSDLKHYWKKIAAFPGGKALFSKAIGLIAPYTGTIDPRVLSLEAGRAQVSMRDRRAVRNHLKSVHAVALANLAELTGSLALVSAMPDDARMIPVGLSIEYVKKARGRLSATGEAPVIATNEKQEFTAQVTIENAGGETVAKATVRCRVGPKSA